MASALAITTVEIFTDGACTGNPGPGGYGVILNSDDTQRELSAGYRLTTNNRMEILAAIAGLQALESRSRVTLYTDSQYLSNGISKGWAKKWRSNNWMRTPKDRAINSDLWATLLDLCDQHDVTFVWVRGHAGHPENERCDRLSVRAAGGTGLAPDIEYEKLRRN